MLAMTTSPSEKSLAHASLLKQQRELEKEKRAAEKLRSMTGLHDKPTPLFNPPVKKEYNDETATRIKSLLGEPASIAGTASRHSSRSQDRKPGFRASLPLPPMHHDMDALSTKAGSPAVAGKPGDSSAFQATVRPAASHGIGLSDQNHGKVFSTAVSSCTVASSASPRVPASSGLAPSFGSISENGKLQSPWHGQLVSTTPESSTVHKISGHIVATSAHEQDNLSPHHDSVSDVIGVFTRPLPKTFNGMQNGMKPSLPRLIIGEEPVDNDVSSILQEMRTLTRLSGINTPRKETPLLRFPVPNDLNGYQQPISSIADVGADRTGTSATDNDVLAELELTDSESETEESRSSSNHSASDSRDDSSLSHDSNSDDDQSSQGTRNKATRRREHFSSSRPPEVVLATVSNASYGAHSGDSWSLEHLCRKVDTPPSEPPSSLAQSSTRTKLLPCDKLVTQAKLFDESLTNAASNLQSPMSLDPDLDGGIDAFSPSMHFSSCSAKEASICTEVMEEGHDTESCPPDLTNGDDVTAADFVPGFPEEALLPQADSGADNVDDEDITVDIESVSPSSIDKAGLRQNGILLQTHASSLPTHDSVSSNLDEMRSLFTDHVKPLSPIHSSIDLNVDAQSQPDAGPKCEDLGCDEVADTDVIVREDNICTSLIATTTMVQSELNCAAGSPIVQSPKSAASASQLASIEPVTAIHKQSDGVVAPVTLKVEIPLHFITRLPPHFSSKIVTPSHDKDSSIMAASENRDSSTVRAGGDDDIVHRSLSQVHSARSSSFSADADHSELRESEGSKSVGPSLSKHSAKRKGSDDQDSSSLKKKAKSSKPKTGREDQAKEPKPAKAIKESKKGPAKVAASMQTPSQDGRTSDGSSVVKKPRLSTQPLSVNGETASSHGAAKTGEKAHGDRTSCPQLPPPAPPCIPQSTGPSYINGLPRAVQLQTSDIDGLSEYSRSPDFYLPEAKLLKHKADSCGDILQKYLFYLESIHMFLLCGRAIERESPTNMTQIYKMYLDTYRLLSHIHKHVKNLDANDGRCKSRQFGAWTILSLWTQSLLCQKLYKLFRPENEKNHKVMEQFFKHQEVIGSSTNNIQTSSAATAKNHGSPASPAPSPSGSVTSTSSLTSDNGHGPSGKAVVASTPPRPPGSTGSAITAVAPVSSAATVSVPMRTYASMKGYAQNVRLLEMCHQYWDQADMLVMEENIRAFFTSIEERVPALTLHSSITHLAHYLKVAMKNLRKMPEPSSSSGRYS